MSQMEKKKVREIFVQSQHSATSHEKLCKQMKQLYETMPADDFLTEFTNCLKVPFVHGDKYPTVENTLNFAAKFSVSLMKAKSAKQTDGSDNDEEEDEEEMCPFLLNIFKLLFENHNTENQGIRFRVCQFVNKLLNSLGNEACIDDNLCDEISDCMMERLQDKAPAVRTQALMALHRLQDPTDPNCPVMKAFMFHMSSDPSADVRRAVITNIAITAQSVRSILERTHDVKDLVRRTAYMNLSKLSVQRFTINQRVRLLTDGLKDHSEIVRNCVSKVMLPSWLQFYKGSFLSLLHALDCENSTDISTLALQTLFKSELLRNVLEQLTKLLNEDKVIPVEELTPENVLYWRVLFEYLEAHPEIADDRPIDEPLPEILPELSTFCNYIRKFYLERSVEEAEHWVKLQHQYILQQLLELSKGFDLADEMGRSNLRQLCIDLLTSNRVSEDVVPVLVQVIVKVVPDVDDRLQSLAEVISEVREPLSEQESEPTETVPEIAPEEARQIELKQAAIRVKINEKKEEQDEAIRDQDFIKAQQIKEEWQKLQLEFEALAESVKVPAPVPVPQEEVRDVVINRAALCKCLRIVREMVQSDSVKSLTATLRSLMHNFVLPCLQEDNSTVIRNKALEALGLFSLLDQELAKENFVMFCFQIANDEVCEVALKVTFDLLHLYGLETFQVEEDKDGDSPGKRKSKKKKKNLFATDMYDDEFEDDDESQENQTSVSSGSANTANLIAMLTSLLDSASTSMRNLAMEGLYKLLMACRITSSALLSRLVLMWYSPVTEGDESLRQPLGVFLTVYASHCPRSQETLEQAFLPTLRTLMQAPVISPLTQVDQDSVARLFISLTRAGINKFHSKTSHVHNNLAISLCNEILNAEDDCTNLGVLLRALRDLELSLDDIVFREELKTLIKNMREAFRLTKEKQYLQYVEKFRQKVEDFAENTIRSSEVDNTAATDQLEGLDSRASINTTSATINSMPSKTNQSKAIDKLLPPHIHSILAERENEDDEEEEDSQPSRSVPETDIIVPPSPPQSQSEDEMEDDVFDNDYPKKGKKKATSSTSDDAVFKQPAQPKRATKSKPGRGNTRATLSSVDSDTSSPQAKKLKPCVDENEDNENDDVLKGNKAGQRLDAKPDGSKGKRNKKSEKDTNIEETTQPEKQKVAKQNKVEQMAARPKRSIHPTEKGATLKTFQESSPDRSSPVKSPTVSPPSRDQGSPRPRRSLTRTKSSSQDESSPERPLKKMKVVTPVKDSEKKVQSKKNSQKNPENATVPPKPLTRRSLVQSSPDAPSPVSLPTRRGRSQTERPMVPTRAKKTPMKQKDNPSENTNTSPAITSTTSSEMSITSASPEKRGAASSQKSSSTSDSPRISSQDSPVPTRRARHTRSSSQESSSSSPAPQGRQKKTSSQESSDLPIRRGRNSTSSQDSSPVKVAAKSATHQKMKDSSSSQESSPVRQLRGKTVTSSQESPSTPARQGNVEDTNSQGSSRATRRGKIGNSSSQESSPSVALSTSQDERLSSSQESESSPAPASRGKNQGSSSQESTSGVSLQGRRGSPQEKSSPAPSRCGKIGDSSQETSPAVSRRGRSAASSQESSPAPSIQVKTKKTKKTVTSLSPIVRVQDSSEKNIASSGSDSSPVRTRRSIAGQTGQETTKAAKQQKVAPKPTAEVASPIPATRRGRLAGKGKDTDDQSSSPKPTAEVASPIPATRRARLTGKGKDTDDQSSSPKPTAEVASPIPATRRARLTGKGKDTDDESSSPKPTAEVASPILATRRGRLAGKGKDTDDESSSPLQPSKRLKTKMLEDSPVARQLRTSRSSIGQVSQATPPNTRRMRVVSDSAGKARKK